MYYGVATGEMKQTAGIGGLAFSAHCVLVLLFSLHAVPGLVLERLLPSFGATANPTGPTPKATNRGSSIRSMPPKVIN